MVGWLGLGFEFSGMGGEKIVPGGELSGWEQLSFVVYCSGGSCRKGKIVCGQLSWGHLSGGDCPRIVITYDVFCSGPNDHNKQIYCIQIRDNGMAPVIDLRCPVNFRVLYLIKCLHAEVVDEPYKSLGQRFIMFLKLDR